MKIRLSDAVKQGIVPVGRTKLYDDAAKGKFSWTTDNQGKRVADIAELERHYGKLSTPESDTPQPSDNGHLSDDRGLIESLQSQNASLQARLVLARQREEQLLRTNQKLIDMLFDAQADNRTLVRQNGQLALPPAPAKRRWWEKIAMIGF